MMCDCFLFFFFFFFNNSIKFGFMAFNLENSVYWIIQTLSILDLIGIFICIVYIFIGQANARSPIFEMVLRFLV